MSNADVIREMMQKYSEERARIYRELMSLSLNEITAYMRGNGVRHITELADLLARRSINQSLGITTK